MVTSCEVEVISCITNLDALRRALAPPCSHLGRQHGRGLLLHRPSLCRGLGEEIIVHLAPFEKTERANGCQLRHPSKGIRCVLRPSVLRHLCMCSMPGFNEIAFKLPYPQHAHTRAKTLKKETHQRKLSGDVIFNLTAVPPSKRRRVSTPRQRRWIIKTTSCSFLARQSRPGAVGQQRRMQVRLQRFSWSELGPFSS